METSEVVEIIKKAVAGPLEVEVDGQRVKNHSADSLLSLAKFIASDNAVNKGKLRLRKTKMVSGGAIE